MNALELRNMCVKQLQGNPPFNRLILMMEHKPRSERRRLFGRYGGPIGRVLDYEGSGENERDIVSFDAAEVIAYLDKHGGAPAGAIAEESE